MSFNTFSFLALLAVALLARWTIGRDSRARAYLSFLLFLSLVFYSWHTPAYLILLLLTALIDYVAAAAIAAERRRLIRMLFLTLSLVSNLGLLAFLKYGGLGFQAFNDLRRLSGMPPISATWVDIVLPIGLSFYTFQSLSYTIDVYRGVLRPVASFWRFLLFISFFPQLVAGPIVRATDFLFQFHRRRRPRLAVFLHGARLMIEGFFLKMVVADNAGMFVDRHWQAGYSDQANGTLSLLTAVLFSVQIFADFAGYSQIARGVAYMLGFRILPNFNCPYIAASFRDFWSRWHISLSSWFRDYLYVPLGGNRGSRLRTLINLMIVMGVAGLWHGANYTFIVWGALHGLFLVLERAANAHDPAGARGWRRLIGILLVQSGVLVAWVFFRSDTVAHALQFLEGVVTRPYLPLSGRGWVLPTLAACAVPLLHMRAALAESGRLPKPGRLELAFASGVMAYLILTAYGPQNTFVYFQF